MIIFFNGKYLNENNSSINVKDRGILLGDGAFETILYKNNKIFFLDLHFFRLKKTLTQLFIAIKENENSIEKKIISLIKRNNLLKKDLAIRITVTRGYYSRGIDINLESKPTVIISLSKIKSSPNMIPLKLFISPIKRNESSLISTNKTLNYLDNIIAKKQAQDLGFDDALFINHQNKVCCTTIANIYFFQNRKLFTPPLKDGVLNGVIREILISKKKVAVKSITINNLKNCEEIFVSNSIIGVRPVSQLGVKKYLPSQKVMEVQQFLKTLGM